MARVTRVSPFVAVALASLASGCGSEVITEGLEEPIRVESGQFREGTLPGLPPLTPEEIGAGVLPVTPAVTDASKDFQTVSQGDRGKQFKGHASTDTQAVAVRFADVGSGYWVVPVGGPDFGNDGQFSWSFNTSFSPEVPPGNHPLAFAAIGADGRSGTQQIFDLCVTPEIPDNLNACVPTLAPPYLVVSLGWDSAADLDLQVVTPSGKRVDTKHVTTAVGGVGMPIDPNAPGVGILDRDSNGDCVQDGVSRENLVFETEPPPGRYYVYVDLFDACGEASATFTVSLVASAPGAEPNTFRQLNTFEQSGVLLAAQADGGGRLGMFLTEFVVQ